MFATKPMRICSMLAFGWTVLTAAASGSEDLYIKVMQLDGLPLHISEVRAMERKDHASGKGPIELSSAFRRMGCDIPEGGVICNLDEHSHGLVNTIIQSFYHTENLVATWRAYYNLLEPLSADERLRTVTRIGFLPDPLVASVVAKIRTVRSLPVPEVDPFAPDAPPPKPLNAEELAQLKNLEKTASDLLEISMRHLKEQLAVIDAGKAKQKSADINLPETKQPPP